MGFTASAKTAADILDEIVNGLISTNLWHNVDTTWNTQVRTENNARVVLCYGTAGAVGKGNTILSANLIFGTKVVSVADTTNFNVGDKIVVGPPGACNIPLCPASEVRIIASISSGTLTLDANVNITHYIGERCANVDLEIYMAVEVINQTNGLNFYSAGSSWYYGKGFRFVFSASWDATAHTYPTSNQVTLVPFESHYTGYGGYVIANLATLMVSYYLWIENNGNGFAIMGRPEPIGTSTAQDSNQQSFIIVVERNPAKEYTDGYTNFYLFSSINQWQNCLYDGYWQTTSTYKNRCLLRPFAYQFPDYTLSSQVGTYNANGNGISFVPTPSYYAFKSNGNNKVYYVKPIIHNQSGQSSPIFQSDLFFMWSEGVGLVDGDVVSIEGRTTKYLCKGLDSPDNASRINFAIKYVE